jgi:hypothetical protein
MFVRYLPFLIPTRVAARPLLCNFVYRVTGGDKALFATGYNNRCSQVAGRGKLSSSTTGSNNRNMEQTGKEQNTWRISL